MVTPMDADKLQDDLFFLISYLITSARGLYDEPADYGVFRLLDTAGRLMELMDAHGLMDDTFFPDLKTRIAEEVEGSMDSGRQRERLDELLKLVTAEMQKRLDK